MRGPEFWSLYVKETEIEAYRKIYTTHTHHDQL